MTETKYRSNVGIIAALILVLFVASTLSAGPAAGATRDAGDGQLEAVANSQSQQFQTVGNPTTGDLKTSRPEPTAPGGIKVQPPQDGYRLDAELIGAPDGLAGNGTQHGNFNNCFVDFNDDAVLSALPYQASDSIIRWPYWNQYCSPPSDVAIGIEPIGTQHLHLEYVDSTLRWCTDIADFGRPIDPEDALSNCTAIDPLSEPREAVRPHAINYAVRIFAYNTTTRDRVPFTMNQLRIVSGVSEICFVKTDLPWIAAGPTDQPAGYCGELGVGNWDVSASIVDAYEVRIYQRTNHSTFTDIGLNTF